MVLVSGKGVVHFLNFFIDFLKYQLVTSFVPNAYRICRLHVLKLKAFLNFKSSTHSVVVKWPVEFGFIVGSRYVQVYPLANSTCVHTWKLFFFLQIVFISTL